ncbi:MAG: hypothetical protein MUC43_17845 [Pirellula sp.]|nr:hypothetical protein [Pirellula sp.]
MKPKAILAYCREKGIRTIDLRFTDLFGNWQHLTFPVTAISESTFEEGFGQEVYIGPDSVAFPSAEMGYAVIVPSSDANYLDASTDPPTLVLVSTIQDVLHRQESPWDSRNVAHQAVRFLESTSIADEIYVRNLLKFQLKVALPSQGATGFDDAFKFRCQLMNRAIDAGVNVERHFHHPSIGSSFVLQPTKVLESCDDVAMTRYLMSQLALEEGVSLEFENQFSSIQWKLLKNGEPILPGNSARGISDVGRFAQGGISKHANSLTAIFLASLHEKEAIHFPFAANAAIDAPESLSRSVQDSQSSRSRVIEVRGIPTQGNQYLASAAILMAMIDGILNKIAPPQTASAPSFIFSSNSSAIERARTLSDALSSDSDYLLMGDVFSQDLLSTITSHYDSISNAGAV